MAQYGVPSADTYIGNWLDDGEGSSNIYTSIVPGTPGSIGSGDDSTYIHSPSAPSSEPYVTAISTLEDPVSSSGHIHRWRRQKNASGGATIDLTVEIRQDYVNEGTPGTQINTYSDSDIPSAWATQTDTLSGAEADSITDYTSLFMRFVANQV